MAPRPIEILINARDNASGVFSSLQAKVAGVAVAIAGYFGVSIFKDAISSASDLESQLADVQAVSGATKDEMLLLRKAAEEAGSSTSFTATEAATALGNLARSGLDANQAIAALPATLSLAQAGSIGLEQSSAIMTKTLAGFGLEASNAARVADVLAMGANASNTSVNGLGDALSYAAPTAQALGLSLESTVAIIGKFADGGIDASRAGTALNSIMAQFGDPASKFRKELAAAGITTNNFESALVQLGAAGDKGKNAIRAVGTEAGPALQSLLNQGVPALEALRQKLVESQGSAATFAKVLENNLAGASKGLASAWDGVKIALGTPVLPVLQKAVEDLSASLRSSIQDGTVGKFGDAIAKGFQSAVTWAKAFLAEVDFDAMAKTLRDAADRAGEAFDAIATSAKNAGDIVRTGWGVMSAGANAVLTVVYTVGEAFAGVASGIQSGVALILDGLAKITFGDVSASFKAAADDIRLSAEATGAASEALASKARQAFIDMGDGAQLARNGFTGLTTEVGAATVKVDQSKAVFDALAESVGGVANQDKLNSFKNLGDAAVELGNKTQVAAAAQTKATADTRAEVQALRKDYEAALAAGDVQGAVEKMVQLQKALRQTGADAKDVGKAAQESAAAITTAFANAGIKTKAELLTLAQNARQDFDTIKNSGQASADGLAQAFKRMADSAVASGDAGQIAFAKSEAAANGYRVEVDAAGKATVVSMKEAAAAAEATARSFGQATEAVSGYAQGVAQAADQLRKLQAVQGLAGAGGDLSGVSTKDLKQAQADLLKQGGALSSKEYIKLRNELVGRGEPTTDKNGFSLDKSGNRLAMGSELGTLTGVKNFLQQAGLDEAKAKEVALEFSDSKGEIPYFSNPGQLKYGGRNDTISSALLKAAERVTFAPTPPDAPRPPGTTGARTVTIELRNGGTTERINTDELGAEALIRTLQQAGLSSIRR